jgi:dolichyl-phosphate-mannose--protein O-mannosyl transferase
MKLHRVLQVFGTAVVLASVLVCFEQLSWSLTFGDSSTAIGLEGSRLLFVVAAYLLVFFCSGGNREWWDWTITCLVAIGVAIFIKFASVSITQPSGEPAALWRYLGSEVYVLLPLAVHCLYARRKDIVRNGT